ncbi:MAG: ABC transporter permease [Lachnospiraceae bacterium]|nr:MAG: ABC transporter permease [Lachnospiraceae bacterium]
MLVFCTLFLLAIMIVGSFINESHYGSNFAQKNLPPSLEHIFGTDWLGRDMFFRSLKGMTTSIWIGLIASLVSSVLAVVLGTLAATAGKKVDSAILWLVDLFQGKPHLIFLMFISILVGKGVKGILIGVAVTHWTGLTRIVRAEILALKTNQYILQARKLGQSPLTIAVRHIQPHILPQFFVGLVLLFPHAILHEASLTFLGFGIPLEQPAIGVILSESMRYITLGMWWLAVFPGLLLLSVVMLFDGIGGNLKKLIDPKTGQE